MARRPTLYDFSSLSLRPDGTRVQQSTPNNLKPRYAAGSVQDSRGNWFARDAAGSRTVGKYRKVREKREEQEIETDGEEYKEDDSEKSGSKGKGKMKQKSERSNPRPAKRRKFMQNFDFLVPATTVTSAAEQPLPTSDLLKAIHYFASSYYHERGQLFDATKEYRKMRKRNKLRRLKEQGKADESCEDSGEQSDEESEEIEQRAKSGRKKGVVGRTVYRKDMYKILDGSALMAIGMLMQEYVSRILEPRVPDDWEEIMRKFYPDMGNEEIANDEVGSGLAETDDSSEEDDDDESQAGKASENEEKSKEESCDSDNPGQEETNKGSNEG